MRKSMILHSTAVRFLPISFFILCFCSSINAQFQNPPKIETPNTASLGSFGDYQVNQFTGSPGIQIPLFTLTSGNIQVPVNLRYNAAAVRTTQEPGWVGQGWDIQATGAITRSVRGSLDEFYIATSGAVAPNTAFYYPFPGQTVSTGAEYANLPNWNTAAQLAFDFTSHANVNANPQIMGIDVQADEFSFNFMGHSGKFYWSGPSKGWEVVSDEKIKVILNSAPEDFFSPNDVVNEIKKFQLPGISGSALVAGDQSRMFKSFTLVTPDGTKFIFGGTDAVEFYSNRHVIVNNVSPRPVFIATTWLLKKVIDVNNNEVQFNYRRNLPTVKMNLSLYEMNGSCLQNTPLFTFFLPRVGASSFSNGYVEKNLHSSILQWPMYLTEIVGPNETVAFNASQAVCKRYSDDQIRSANTNDIQNTQFDNSLLGMDYPVNLSRVRFEKLDNITVTESFKRKMVKKFVFEYSNTETQRLTLNAFKETGIGNGSGSRNYSFDYNSMGTLPLYDGNYSDHWGYYNGTDIDLARAADLYGRKSVNGTSASPIGLLTKITYPTGGFTQFVWEQHDVSSQVTISRTSLAPLSNNTKSGGFRIAEVQNYSAPNVLAGSKKYYYKKGYYNGANIATLTSSGVLNGDPRYSFSLSNRQGVLGGATTLFLNVNYFSGVQNLSYSQGSHVGYDEVAEVNNDGSYTRYFFTNYGTDANGVSHFDIPPAGYLGWLPGQDTYFPMSDLETERGKLVAAEIYNTSNILLQKTKLTYRNDAARFNNYIKVIDNNGSYGAQACADALVLSTARPVFNYNYYTVNSTTTKYDQNGNNPQTESTDFTYNENNLLRSEAKTDSKNSLITTTYKYPTDYADFPSQSAVLQAMKNAGILSPVVDVTVISGVSTPINQKHTNYSNPSAGIFLPQDVTVKIGANASESRAQFTKFDSYGNILEQQNTNDAVNSYIRDYKGRYVVAAVLNAPYNNIAFTSFEISSYSSYPVVNQIGNWNIPLNWSAGPNGYNPVNLVNTDFFTGSTSYNLSSGSITSLPGFIAANRYIVSYWSKNGQYTVSGSASVKTGLIINGWTYYEHEITGVTTVTVSGAGLIDELRLYPQNAQMTTYTYKAGVGITGQCDPTNQVITYEYDAYNRLVLIRDHNKKILKKICYNYAGQPQNCDYTGNQLMSQVFTRSNCPADYVSGTYTYTVPADKYLSPIGLDDANSQAQNEINTYGQATADAVGPCNPVIKSTNGTSVPYTITFTNTAGGSPLTFSAYPSSTTQQVGSVPTGTYNVTVAPMYSSTSTIQLLYNSLSVQTGISFSYPNVVVSTPQTFTFSYPVSSGPCTFTANSAGGWGTPYSNFYTSGTTVNFSVVLYHSGAITWSSSNQAGTITGGCVPPGYRGTTVTENGRTWGVSISPTGQMSIQLYTGTPPGSSFQLTGSYSL